MAGAAGAAYHRQQSYEEPVRFESVQPQTFGTQQTPMAGSVLDEMNKGTFEQKTMPLPEGFDMEAFLSVAEKNFAKMQKAWDTGNVTALSEFTSDDVFLAVTHQLRERGAQDYTTEIVTLKSDFRGIVQDGDEYLAGVHFDGTLNVNGEAERVDETWILSKPVNGKGGWLLSGIHQEDQA
jgi:predicted lipid-binding transport protein (Tim44 family)